MRYGAKMKIKLVKRMLLPGFRGMSELSKESGISAKTLYKWRSEYIQNGGLSMDDRERRPEDWTILEKYHAILEAAGKDESSLGYWLREQGLHSEHLTIWRQEIQESLQQSGKEKRRRLSEPERRVRELEREVGRKDKALAEVSAALVLKKKLNLLFPDAGA